MLKKKWLCFEVPSTTLGISMSLKKKTKILQAESGIRQGVHAFSKQIDRGSGQLHVSAIASIFWGDVSFLLAGPSRTGSSRSGTNRRWWEYFGKKYMPTCHGWRQSIPAWWWYKTPSKILMRTKNSKTNDQEGSSQSSVLATTVAQVHWENSGLKTKRACTKGN